MTSRSYEIAKSVIPIALTTFFLVLSKSFMGISVGDDSLYMGFGNHMDPSSFLIYHDWAPLYSLWFRLLGTLCHDPVARYFLSWALLVLVVALLPALFKTPAAWLYTLIVLTLPIMTEGPFVGLFASAVLLGSLCWLLPQRLSFAEALCAACILSFCLSFCRPEYNYGVVISAAATLLAVVTERLSARSASNISPHTGSRIPAAVLLFTVIVLASMTLFFVKNYPSHRSGMAFAQHFNGRAAMRGIIPAGPDCWRSNYAELRFGVDTTHNAANGTATIGEFFRANPRLFLGQIFYNLTDPHAVFLLLFVSAIVLLPWLPWPRKARSALRPAGLFLLLLCLPPLAGSIVIFPHTHYAAVIVPSLILFALQFLHTERWLQPLFLWIVVPGVALLGYLYIARPRMAVPSTSFERLNLLRIQCVRPWDEPATNTNPAVFSVADIAPVYLNGSRKLVLASTLSNWVQFQSWATQTRPAWISIDTPGAAQYGFTPLATQYGITGQQLAVFLQQDLHYTPHPCSTATQLIVYTR